LERGLKILELLAETGGLSVSEVAARLGMHRSASHRFLATLRELGYVMQDPSSRYRLTFKLFELGMRVVHTLEIRQVALPFMKELAEITHETVNMGHWDGKEIIYIDKIASQEILRLDLAVGSRVPVYCSALGKAILAFRPEEEVQAVLKTLSMNPLTPKTITDPEDLQRQLSRVKETGYAIDDEEMGIGIRCIAAPVFDYSGYPEYALSVEGPISRMTKEKVRSIKDEVTRICGALSKSLGQNGGTDTLQHR
jgi:DNA-binding IclR family transcriptional regulator